MARDFLGEQPGIKVDSETVGSKWVSVESNGFDGNLAPTDDTVQKCLQKLDDLVIEASGPCYIDGGRADEVYGACPSLDGGDASGL